MNWLRLVHALGLTNLSDADVRRYEEQVLKVAPKPSERRRGLFWRDTPEATFNAEPMVAFPYVGRVIRYAAMGVCYLAIFVPALATLGLVEIRQAHLKDFDALIAMLEQRDRYDGPYFDRILSELTKQREQLQSLAATLSCPNAAPTQERRHPAEPPPPSQNADSGTPIPEPKTCDEIRALVIAQLNDLTSVEDDLLFRRANLAAYYDNYQDGITEKSPALIPVLHIMNSRSRLLTAWTRAPLELLEMILLVFMGALGGVVSVAHRFFDPATANPSLLDLCYRPAAGAVMSLGVYVLIRASEQLFVLAFLGLVAGFVGSEAVRRIEFAAMRLFRNTERGADIAEASDRRRPDMLTEPRAEVPDRPGGPRQHPA
jgi:hypothetical protein